MDAKQGKPPDLPLLNSTSACPRPTPFTRVSPLRHLSDVIRPDHSKRGASAHAAAQSVTREAGARDATGFMTRRASILGLLLVAVLLIVLGSRSWSVAVDIVERHVISRVEGRTGLKIAGFSRAEIALLPLPRISLSNVTFAHPDKQIAGKAPHLRARARLLSLLAAQLDFDRIDLLAPEIDVAASPDIDGVAGWIAGPLDYLTRLQNDTKLVIAGGRITVKAGATALTTVESVNLVIDDRSVADPISMSGAIEWRGRTARVQVVWPVGGDQAPLSLAIGSDLMNFRLNGTRTGRQEPVIAGHVDFSTRSLSDTLDWIGARPRVASLVQQVELTAQAQFVGQAASLSNVVAKLDGDRLEGVLKIGNEASKWALSGTLAGSDFDLERLVRQGRMESTPTTARPGETPLAFGDWTSHEVDLRLSLDTARLGSAKLEDLAAQLMIRKGRFEASLLRANVHGGAVRARILGTGTPAGTDVKLQIGLDRINLAQAGADWPALARMGGTAHAQLTLDGLGDSIEQVTRSLTGRGTVTVKQGEIRGMSFAELLRRAEKPTAAARDWRQGKSTFETAQFNAQASNGVLYLTEGQIVGSAYQLAMNGSADLSRRWIDLTGNLTAASSPARAAFELKGPFDTAAVVPDFEALLTR